MALIDEYWNKHNEKQINLFENKGQLTWAVNNKDNLAYNLGKVDIGFFAKYFLMDAFIPSDENTLRNLSDVHEEIFNELNKMFILNETDKEEFILPRGLGKSTVINKLLGTWSHCYKISIYTVVVGKTEDDAIGFIDTVKEFLQFKKITDSFGELVTKNSDRVVNKQELELTNNSKLIAMSSGSSMRGTTYSNSEGTFRPSIILVDDFISDKDILTDNAKEKIVNKYYNEILETGDKAVIRNGKIIKSATKFLVIGTPLASDDFINTIKNDAEFRVFHRSVFNGDVDALFSSELWVEYSQILLNRNLDNGTDEARKFYISNIDKMKFETIWNDKYQCYDLANSYFTKRLSFMQELMCDCDNVGEKWIESMKIIDFEEFQNLNYVKSVLSVDQASSSNKKSDYFAFTVLGMTKNKFKYVHKGVLKKFDARTDFDSYINYVLELLKEHKFINAIVLEKNVFKGVDALNIEKALKNDKDFENRNIQIITVYNTKNKDDRIATITSSINNGTIIFNNRDTLYNKQIKDFKGQKFTIHDDAIDSLELAINNIENVKIKRKCIMHFKRS